MPLHIYIYCNICNRIALPGQSRIDTRAVRYNFSHGGCSCKKKSTTTGMTGNDPAQTPSQIDLIL